MNKPPGSRSVHIRGHELIREPLLNKGSGFTAVEREQFGLEGLMPPGQLTIEQQAERVYRNLVQYTDPLQKFVYLASLQDRNEHLYFRLLCDYLEELLPIVYTPTVGLATQRYSHVFQRGRGIWITPAMRGRIADALKAWARDRQIKLIVATDNESILGIGDQGAGGMAISIGKLSLYTAGAGIDPANVLPISLDVGTENEKLLDDPLYLGWPERRLRGTDYIELMDEFVTAVAEQFPGAMIQWEDFRKDNALAVLDRYAGRVPSFNDDIQGTGAVALAGILSAERLHGRALADERILILGAGAAGLGITRQIRAALRDQGISDQDARHRIAALDRRGLIIDDGQITDAYKQELAWDPEFARELNLHAVKDLAAVVEQFRPTVLIGTSGQGGAFSEAIVRAVAEYCDRPVIMPLSNPTANAEATPADLIKWTNGRALISTGSPFADVSHEGRTIKVGQGNNAFIFPGVGLAVLLAGATSVPDALFFAAASALAREVTAEELESGLLYPPISRLREVSGAVALEVMRTAGSADLCAERDEHTLNTLLEEGRWHARYVDYQPA